MSILSGPLKDQIRALIREEIANAQLNTATAGNSANVDYSQAIAYLQSSDASQNARIGYLEQNAYVQVVTQSATDTPTKTPGQPTIFVGPGIAGATAVQEYGDIVFGQTITGGGGGGSPTTSLWNGADTTSWSTPPDMSLTGWNQGWNASNVLKPDATNTGTPPGWTPTTTITGDYHTTANNQQIDGYHITGQLYVDHTGVIIKNSQIDKGFAGAGAVQYKDRTGRAMYCQIGSDGSGAANGQASGVSNFMSLYRCNVYRFNDNVHPTDVWSSTQVQYRDCFFHTAVVTKGFEGNPNADSHSDEIQWDAPGNDGNFGNLLVHHCTIRSWGICDYVTPKQTATKSGGQNDGNLTGSQNSGGALASNGLTTDGIIINSQANPAHGYQAKDFTIEYCYFDGKAYGHFTTGPSKSQYSNINFNYNVIDYSSVHVFALYDYVNQTGNYFTDGKPMNNISKSSA